MARSFLNTVVVTLAAFDGSEVAFALDFSILRRAIDVFVNAQMMGMKVCTKILGSNALCTSQIRFI